MRAALLLGIRLSLGKGEQRTRTLVTGTASAVGVAVVLLVWGIAISALGTTTQFRYNPGALTLLLSGTIGMVALPVVVLIATIARLAAGVRDRRLANLRLLGLTEGQTRLVASAEVGFAGVLGSMLGAALAGVVAAVGTGILQSDADWGDASLWAPTGAWLLVPVSVPAVAVIAAVLPQRLSSQQALAHTRQRDAGPVRLIRVAPLLMGFALCWSTRAPLFDSSSSTLEGWEVAATIVGIALLGIGMLLVIPVFMALIAAVLVRLGGGALTTMVGRRLQTQPASATRVIAALMMGLFIVVGTRGVLVVFLATPQYVAAADFVEREQTAEITAPAADLHETVADLASVEGVRRVTAFPILHGEPEGALADGFSAVTVVVASCEELSVPGCSDDAPRLVGDPWSLVMVPNQVKMQVRSQVDHEARGPTIDVDLRDAAVIDAPAFERTIGALSGTPVVVVPPTAVGVAELAAVSDRLVVAHAGPGRYLYDSVADAGYQYNSSVDLENYDFVQGMLTVVWTLAAVIIALGLATFTIAGIDRALGRRRELTALRLIGTPHSLLRRAQWLEAALPTVLGSAVAILAGAYAGATYLQRDDSLHLSATSAVLLAVTACATSVLLAGVTTIGTDARLDPEHIRSE